MPSRPVLPAAFSTQSGTDEACAQRDHRKDEQRVGGTAVCDEVEPGIDGGTDDVEIGKGAASRTK